MTHHILFPHQLYGELPAAGHIHLVEDELYFRQYNFHQQKLLLHRASMEAYADTLREAGKTVTYWESEQVPSLQPVFEKLQQNKVQSITYYETSDYYLEKRLQGYSGQYGITLEQMDNPNFLNPASTIQKELQQDKNYFMTSFYIRQRKQRGILLEGDDKPLGGKWSYDPENRKKIPKGLSIPHIPLANTTPYHKEAQDYIAAHFPNNYGSAEDIFYPVTHQAAAQWLDTFLEQRMATFGDYEDAIVADRHFLFHSVLTPMLNIGLLSPQQIIDRTLEAHREHNFPLNSLEGFLRQIIGWREYMRGIYLLEGRKQRTTNGWGFTRQIPESFWNGTTGIDPVDQTIHKLLRTGYNHHIERLMVMGNFMLLCELHPDAVYEWFMSLYIDAYDWVMVPNVYGMSQYADKGLITTKPYVSSSNYIRKMSDYKKGDWCATWDGLFWRFIHVHRDVFESNNRMQRMVWMLDKMDRERLHRHLEQAEHFLGKL